MKKVKSKLDDIIKGAKEKCVFVPTNAIATVDNAVKHPSHYTQGRIECIDYILDKGLNFPLGNAVKYITRAGHKKSSAMDDTAKTIQDLRKAIQYIEFEIERLEGRR